MEEEQNNYGQELRRARIGKAGEAKQATLALAGRTAEKLNEMIEQGHETGAFVIAILLACIKDGMDDILDLLLIGNIPILGQLPGFFVSATLMYFLWGKGWFNTTKVKVIVWVLGFFIDNMPAVNALPLTVLSVIMAWHVVRKKARGAEEKLQNLHQYSFEELENINEEAEEYGEAYA